MQHQLTQIINSIDAEYSDIRYEKNKRIEITYSGQNLEHISKDILEGYVIRVLRNGGFASSIVSRKEDIPKAIKTALAMADLNGRDTQNRVSLARTEPIQDEYFHVYNENPLEVPLQAKHDLLLHYNSLILDYETIQSTQLSYHELYRDRFFANSRGSYIHEPLMTASIYGTIIARKGDDVQNARVAVGGIEGFQTLRKREKEFEERALLAGKLLDAEPVQGGTYRALFDSELTGVFVHEAFGHFSEADSLENTPSLRDRMTIGTRLGPEAVTIIDDPTHNNHIGYYRYDDEGVRVKPVVLLDKGVIQGHLHSLRTAAYFNEPVNGHCVSEDCRFSPLVRMGCISIQSQKKSVANLIQEVDRGIYLVGSRGGQTSGENFTFGAMYGFLIEKGKISKMIREINVMGNIFTSLNAISHISDTTAFREVGGCGKGKDSWQMNVKSCHGGPHIVMENTLIGGI